MHDTQRTGASQTGLIPRHGQRKGVRSREEFGKVPGDVPLRVGTRLRSLMHHDKLTDRDRDRHPDPSSFFFQPEL